MKYIKLFESFNIEEDDSDANIDGEIPSTVIIRYTKPSSHTSTSDMRDMESKLRTYVQDPKRLNKTDFEVSIDDEREYNELLKLLKNNPFKIV